MMNQSKYYVEESITGLNIQDMPFESFLKNLKERMKSVFHVRADIDKMAIKRGMPPFVMREIMSLNPLAVGIPYEFGGRGCHMKENLALLATASYESLALSLTFGINSALFLQPVAKYAQYEAKAPIFDRFLNQQNMGGLMITEPDFGSGCTKYANLLNRAERKIPSPGNQALGRSYRMGRILAVDSSRTQP